MATPCKGSTEEDHGPSSTWLYSHSSFSRDHEVSSAHGLLSFSISGLKWFSAIKAFLRITNAINR